MKNTKFSLLYLCLSVLSLLLSGIVRAQQTTDTSDYFAGYFSMQGNNGSTSSNINNNIYIKLYKDQWILTLFVPYPYASTVDPAVIDKVFEAAKNQTTTSAYLRGKFGQLTELATVQAEKFGYYEELMVFECSSLAPCTIKPGDGFLDLVKPGIISEHIIKYNQVLTQ